MFGKKNSDGDTMSRKASQAGGGKSLFAGELNIAPAPIDFGLGQPIPPPPSFDQPSPPPDSAATATPPPTIDEEPAYEPPPPLPEEPMPNPEAEAWQPPETYQPDMPIASPPAVEPAPMPEDAGEVNLTGFENDPGYNYIDPTPTEEPAGLESGFDNPATSGLPDYTPDTPALPTGSYWDQVDEVSLHPESSGEFLDTMHAQIYPPDTAQETPGEVDAPEGALEEAARILFPDTATTPVEYEPAGIEADTRWENNQWEESPPADLGNSYQAEASDLQDVSGLVSATPEEAFLPPPVVEEAVETTTPYEPAADADFGAMPEPMGMEPTSFEPAPPASDADFGAMPEPMGMEPTDDFDFGAMPELGSGGLPVNLEPEPEPYSDMPDYPYPEAGAEPVADDFLQQAAPAEEDWLAGPADIAPEMDLQEPVMETQPQAMEDWGPPEPAAYEPTAVSAPETGGPETGTLDIENLQILQVMELDPGKRLLLVQGNGTLALMGQIGTDDQANVGTIKVFSGNPLANDQEFTAVREGSAADKEMFLTKVGAWQAVISADAGTIALHTELTPDSGAM